MYKWFLPEDCKHSYIREQLWYLTLATLAFFQHTLTLKKKILNFPPTALLLPYASSHSFPHGPNKHALNCDSSDNFDAVLTLIRFVQSAVSLGSCYLGCFWASRTFWRCPRGQCGESPKVHIKQLAVPACKSVGGGKGKMDFTQLNWVFTASGDRLLLPWSSEMLKSWLSLILSGFALSG